jgi:hypothetical protein
MLQKTNWAAVAYFSAATLGFSCATLSLLLGAMGGQQSVAAILLLLSIAFGGYSFYQGLIHTLKMLGKVGEEEKIWTPKVS